MKKYVIAQMNEIEPTQCPCEKSRRAFVHPDDHAAQKAKLKDEVAYMREVFTEAAAEKS